MSFRIIKSVGYGLTDLNTTNARIDDPRINPDSPLLRPTTSDELDDYIHYLKTHDDWSLQAEPEMINRLPPHRKDLHRAVNWTGDRTGLPNVLCLRPAYADNWTRHDDPLDHAETLRPAAPPFEPSVVLLTDGPYPYGGQWMDTRTGRRCPSQFTWWIEFCKSPQREHVTTQMLDRLAQRAGFDDHQDALTHAAPIIPEELEALVTWGQLFTDAQTVRQLRPMLYTRLT